MPSSPRSFPPPVPMPYLTELFKTYVENAASVRHHIRDPLHKVWQVVVGYIEEDSLDDPVARTAWLAQAKERFTLMVYYSAASTELKRAMWQLPLEDYFDKCIGCFSELDNLDLKKLPAHHFSRWLVACAMHPQADVDRSLSGTLDQYTMVHESHAYFSAPPNEAAYRASSSFCGHFPQMNEALEGASVFLGGTAHLSVLQAFVQLGADVVDMTLCIDRFRAQGNVDLTRAMISEGLGCVIWAWQNLLDSPFDKLEPKIREYLDVTVDVGALAPAMLRHIKTKVCINSVSKDILHSVMWNSILDYAASRCRVPRSTLQFLIQSTDEPAEGERPIGTTDQVTAQLSARFALTLPLNNNEEMRDVPIEAVGPVIDPRTLGHPVTETPPSDERCPICRGELADDEEPFQALNVCGHLFHVDCLDPWVNRVDLGLAIIQCPYCRAELCNARDYRGVVEE